ncbi:septal ring lytic transglycosylase RlpA family protein [Litoribacter ruber]|uniref:Probable endolytic peptidoglycan transglycosylase RlpA n=1 Tax=Litoribacter ruber TaxID=702568 RepID=A0AAP2CHL9_9BACT|nr:MULTISPECIES: septal ring lytic transglycosylase RlpA family protein [Litoribacter]MBS9524297.1 septal ring lytic transglycosylase RlpA family protein [Litoribacter alkaliphilus]MBT0809903.1 septal ring lytic transglycosylase RlpA family protein [Litoribacter ruber]
MKKILFIGFLIFFCKFNLAEARVLTEDDSLLVIQKGVASFYGKKFHQRKTASGEIFDMHELTAAHKHLPFGTRLRVTNNKNGKQVIVKINDRLPQNSKRVIDLSREAARQLGMINDGVVPVRIAVLTRQKIEELQDYYEEIPKDIRLRAPLQSVTYRKNPDMLFTMSID